MRRAVAASRPCISWGVHASRNRTLAGARAAARGSAVFRCHRVHFPWHRQRAAQSDAVRAIQQCILLARRPKPHGGPANLHCRPVGAIADIPQGGIGHPPRRSSPPMNYRADGSETGTAVSGVQASVVHASLRGTGRAAACAAKRGKPGALRKSSLSTGVFPIHLGSRLSLAPRAGTLAQSPYELSAIGALVICRLILRDLLPGSAFDRGGQIACILGAAVNACTRRLSLFAKLWFALLNWLVDAVRCVANPTAAAEDLAELMTIFRWREPQLLTMITTGRSSGSHAFTPRWSLIIEPMSPSSHARPSKKRAVIIIRGESEPMTPSTGMWLPASSATVLRLRRMPAARSVAAPAALVRDC